jgi:hypothetical protein
MGRRGVVRFGLLYRMDKNLNCDGMEEFRGVGEQRAFANGSLE